MLDPVQLTIEAHRRTVNADPILLEITLAQEHSSVAAVQQMAIVEVRMMIAVRQTATLAPV